MTLARIVELAQRAEGKGAYLILSHQARFNNPLVATERRRLETLEISDDMVSVSQRVVDECPGSALYFPAPLARAVEEGEPWEQAVFRFHYDMIVVDEQQQWTWRGQSVAKRTKDFFLKHMAFEPEIERFFFEYKVNDNWWDKSYLDAAVTPFVANRLEVQADGEVKAVLESGQTPIVDADSFRLDEMERLFVATDGCGEVMVADTERFRILRNANEDLTAVDFAGQNRPLRWPAA